MQRLHVFKFVLGSNGQQARQVRRFAGRCRVVFNDVLNFQKWCNEQGEKKLGYARLRKARTVWRKGSRLLSRRAALWLSGAPVHPLQQALKGWVRADANDCHRSNTVVAQCPA